MIGRNPSCVLGMATSADGKQNLKYRMVRGDVFQS